MTGLDESATSQESVTDEKSGKPVTRSIRFPAYDLADRRFRQRAFECVRRAEPFLGQIKLVESDHAGPIRSVGGANPFDSPQKLHSATGSISVADIEQMNFAGYAAMVNNMAEQLLEAFAKAVFADLGAITDHVGNVVNQKDKTLFEQFKEGVMKVALDFDDDGNLVPKQLVVHPSVKEEATVAMRQVFEDADVRAHILSEREKFLANRKQRQLLSPC